MHKRTEWQTKWKRLAGGVLIATTVLGVVGCGVETVVGAAVIGAYATVDRRTVATQAEDKTILVKGETAAAKIVGDNGHVNVTSYNRKVLLTGEVKDQALKERVGREIAKIDNVLSVVNELEVTFVSGIGSRSNDSYITSKIVASFLDAKDVYGSAIKVVTERGNVYLMGRVTQREGDRAAQIASGVSGVVKVVKIFDYISEEELKRLQWDQSKDKSSSADPQKAPITESSSGRDAPVEVMTSPVR